ncbi:MAG: aminotransferase class I/II-fold pyridoxal phosphate-dependent enzyme [Defluviitaleaceae bacterium]|nr:aminotransferase class I/II-fold pyridoxal phosphate-dependent enzyme [Defluviitaleaceae bacterium]
MYEKTRAYLAKNIYPFHMPGHKRNAEFFPPDMHTLDLTEISGMDTLSAPSGIIKEFSDKIAKIYGAKESFFLTNGSSAGIVAAICAVCDENTIVYAPRNAHVSFYNGLAFSGAMPYYVYDENAFDTMPRGAVAFVVSPTYEGFVYDIEAIAKKVHAKDGILIVDEAHGAHFVFHDYFPKTALQQGADIVINSLHKTLPAISGCAVLHTSREFGRSAVSPKATPHDPLSRLRFFINAMQTTSPSYMLMSACDYMLDKLTPALFEGYVRRLKRMRGVIGGFGDCKTSADPSKFFFRVRPPHTAEQVAEIARRDYKIEFEMAMGQNLLAMTSVADTDEGFLRLERAVCGLLSPRQGSVLENLDTALGNGVTPPNQMDNTILRHKPDIVMSPREALQHKTEWVTSDTAIGRISAELYALYPPGHALIVPGERIHLKVPKEYVQVILA